MMVRLDFAGTATGPRGIRVAASRGHGVALLAEAGPRLPFKSDAVDEIFVERIIARRTDIADTLDELWRISKPGTLIHLRLPHASSTIAVTRDPRAQPMFTLDTFNYYDPRSRPAGTTAFTVERAELHVAGDRGDDSGLALARGRFARVIEKFANKSRGSQYRFERWFANLFGGFEEFSVVLAVVKRDERERSSSAAPEPSVADPTTLRVTSDVEHDAASVEPDDRRLSPEHPPESVAGDTASQSLERAER